MNRKLSGTKIGILGAVALSVGLLGAGVTACDLTQPNRFQQDSTPQGDSSNNTASIEGVELESRQMPVAFLEGAEDEAS